MSDNNPLFDMAQLYSGTKVKIDRNRDVFLREAGLKLLEDHCLMPNEKPQDLFARIAMSYSDDSSHAQRVYDYMSNLWFMPSWEILNKNTLNVSCYLNEAEDSLQSILDLWNENVWAMSRSVPISSYWGNLRSAGEVVGKSGESSGLMPFIKVQEAMSDAINSNSKKDITVHININHPEILKFLELAEVGNINCAILISDAFMRAVEDDADWALVSPHDDVVKETVKAKELWYKILELRKTYGEPYLIFIDNVNKQTVDHHKLAGLNIKMSDNTGSVVLPTGRDQHNQYRAATSCGASVNLVKFEEWENHPQFIEDVIRFIDNVLTDFIKIAPDTMLKAKYGAMRGRAIALGAMGFASFCESKKIEFGSVNAKMWNKRIFKYLKETSDKISIKLAREKGACLDAREYGLQERFSYKLALAPTEEISTIVGGVSNSVEPLKAGVDLRDVIDMAADRSPYICQSQSITLQVSDDVELDFLHMLHYQAWRSGIKTLNSIKRD